MSNNFTHWLNKLLLNASLVLICRWDSTFQYRSFIYIVNAVDLESDSMHNACFTISFSVGKSQASMKPLIRSYRMIFIYQSLLSCNIIDSHGESHLILTYDPLSGHINLNAHYTCCLHWHIIYTFQCSWSK